MAQLLFVCVLTVNSQHTHTSEQPEFSKLKVQNVYSYLLLLLLNILCLNPQLSSFTMEAYTVGVHAGQLLWLAHLQRSYSESFRILW